MYKEDQLKDFIELKINEYHENILIKIAELQLNDVLKRKNPYLFKNKGITSSADLINPILSAYLSSQEEGMFGGVLEQIAIFICFKKFGGTKSSSTGIDLEFEAEGTKYLVAIKSGKNWSNAGSKARLLENFRTAKKILGTNTNKQRVVAVIGICYGTDRNPDKGEYMNLCGQQFWQFISGEDDLYKKIIVPLNQTQQQKDKFDIEYTKVVDTFIAIFQKDYCNDLGEIEWDKLLEFNSSARPDWRRMHI